MSGFKNISIKNKLVMIQVATAFIAILFSCTLFLYNDINMFKNSEIRSKYSIAEIVGVNLISPLLFNDQEAANKILANLKSNPAILNASVLDKAGNQFASYTKTGENPFTFPIPAKEQVKSKYLEQKFLVNYTIYEGKEFVGMLMLKAELVDMNTIINNYIKGALMVILLGVITSIIISLFLQRTISNRLLSLVSKTKAVSETGNYSIRVPSAERDEIGILSKEFNTLLGKVQKGENDLKEANNELEKRVDERTAELNESNLKLSNSNKELEQFAYVASHDLQEPLRTITNYVELLEETYSETKDTNTKQYFLFITSASSRMQALIRDLLEFSRVGRNPEFESVDCNKILKEVITEMDTSIKESNAKITYSVLPVLKGIEIELKRLFQNLISNAIKFRKKDIAPEVEITVSEKETEYVFAVKDNGIGIDEKLIPKLFIIFQRLHPASEYPGTGIGLASAKKIVNLHNGKIWIESKLGAGSTFYFSISKNF